MRHGFRVVNISLIPRFGDRDLERIFNSIKGALRQRMSQLCDILVQVSALKACAHYASCDALAPNIASASGTGTGPHRISLSWASSGTWGEAAAAI